VIGFFRVGQGQLAALCRRLGTSLEAGIDIRRTFERESGGRLPTRLKERLRQISDSVSAGRSLGYAVEQTGEYFPPLFREMLDVGEETGKLAEIFIHLADHYDEQVRLRRVFLSAIAWPLTQFAMALGVIGLLILVMGMLPPLERGRRTDLLGLGLIGPSGLVIYVVFLGVVAVAGFGFYLAVRRGVFWTKPLQKAVLLVPVLGSSLQTLALSRLAWSLHLTMETSMDLGRALLLSLRSTRNARYTDDGERIVTAIVGGQGICEALEATGAYPREFLDTVEVGEQSGRLPESMAILSRQYQDRARRALATLTMLAGFAVWAVVAAIIIVMIFRLAFFYIGTIEDAAQGRF